MDDFEVLVVENGSRDNTLQVAHSLSESSSRISVHSLPKASLGQAIKAGLQAASFEKVVCFPIDLSVGLDFILEAVKLLDSFHIVVGSKRMAAGLDSRPLPRRMASRAYHGSVALLFHSQLSDTSCVKAFRRTKILDLLKAIPSNNSVFETELLLAAEELGLNIVEVPVQVSDSRRGRIPLALKAWSKARDLFSLRVDSLSLYFGGLCLVSGLALMVWLVLQKLVSGRGGFSHPYSFLLALLLVLFGAQSVFFGFNSRLLLQLRGGHWVDYG